MTTPWAGLGLSKYDANFRGGTLERDGAIIAGTAVTPFNPARREQATIAWMLPCAGFCKPSYPMMEVALQQGLGVVQHR
jgi:hypothetical protein